MAKDDETDDDGRIHDHEQHEDASFEVVATIKIPTQAIRQPCADRNQEHTTKPWWKQGANWGAIAAAMSALAALGIFALNYRALRGSQRAWILFDNQGPNTATADGITLYVRNFGHSPALEIFFTPVEWSPIPGASGHAAIVNGRDDLPVAQRLLPPDRMLHVAIPASEFAGAAYPRDVFVVATYRDQFGNHRTRVCVHPKPGETPSVLECDYGQEAD